MERFILLTFLCLLINMSVIAALCPAGKFCTTGTSTVLGTCGSGYYSPLGETVCYPAPTGYWPTGDQGGVALCPSGTPYSKATTGTACTTCPSSKAVSIIDRLPV